MCKVLLAVLRFNVTCDWATAAAATTHTACSLNEVQKDITNELLFWYQYHFKCIGTGIIIFKRYLAQVIMHYAVLTCKAVILLHLLYLINLHRPTV